MLLIYERKTKKKGQMQEEYKVVKQEVKGLCIRDIFPDFVPPGHLRAQGHRDDVWQKTQRGK